MAQRKDAQKKKNKGNKLTAEQKKRAAAKRVARAEEKAKELKKKDKKKRTGKEIAIIVVSVIMVVSILLPSLSSIMNNNSSSSSSSSDKPNPTSYEEAESTYQPLVDEQQAKLDANPDDTQAMYDLATNYYDWAGKASSYASDDTDKKNFANDLYQKAIDEYNAYLDKVGNLDSSDAKTAAINKAMAYSSLDNKDQAKQELQDLADKTNYYMAWFNLAMQFLSDDNQAAMNAWEHVIDSDDSGANGYRSWASDRLTALRKQAQSDTGGPEAFLSKCDYWEGANPASAKTKQNTLMGRLAFRIQEVEDSDDSSSDTSS